MKVSRDNQKGSVLEQRLKHLAAFSGLANWSFSADSDCTPSIADRTATRPRSRFAARLVKTASGFANRLKTRLAAKRQLRENLRELRNLNSHQLQDIGLHPGDVTAIVNGVQTIEEVNKLREAIARPACEVIELADIKTSEKPAKASYLVDNAA